MNIYFVIELSLREISFIVYAAQNPIQACTQLTFYCLLTVQIDIINNLDIIEINTN